MMLCSCGDFDMKLKDAVQQVCVVVLTLSLPLLQTETVVSQDKATWHEEEWQGRSQRK